MNKIYRSIYNESLGTWVAVPETIKAKGKKSGSAIFSTASATQRVVSMSVIGSALMLAGLMLAPTSAMAQCTFIVDNGSNQIRLTNGVPTDCATALGAAVAGVDPVNGSHFYSVNGQPTTDGAPTGNYDNKGAKGDHALAAGVAALAEGKNSIAIGYGASTSIAAAYK